MFGYLLPVQAELKVCEWQAYRAYYCGLCKQLKHQFGNVPRFLLNYDFIVPALLFDAIQAHAMQLCAQRCMASPVRKHPVCVRSHGLSLAADALVLAAYYKVCDDLRDEACLKKSAAVGLRALLRPYYQTAAASLPAENSVLANQTQCQAALEQRQCTCPDEAAEPTAQMTAALFRCAGFELPQQRALFQLGFFLGKIIYYLDAAEDYEQDAVRGSYNVFLSLKLTRQQAIAQAQLLCRLCAAQAARCYHLLSLPACVQRAILENILFLGVPRQIDAAGTARRRQPRFIEPAAYMGTG